MANQKNKFIPKGFTERLNLALDLNGFKRDMPTGDRARSYAEIIGCSHRQAARDIVGDIE